MTRRALTESPNSLRVLKAAAYNFTYLGDADEVKRLALVGLALAEMSAVERREVVICGAPGEPICPAHRKLAAALKMLDAKETP